MKKHRFLASWSRSAVPASSNIERSNMYDFLTPESAPIYRITMKNYELAKTFLEQGEFEEASKYIATAIKRSFSLKGQTPAISSIRMDLFELQDSIESVRSPSKHQ